MISFEIIAEPNIWYETKFDVHCIDEPRCKINRKDYQFLIPKEILRKECLEDDYVVYRHECKVFILLPYEIYSIFFDVGFSNKFLEFSTFGISVWSKQSIQIARADLIYWLEHLDLAMNNTKHSPNIENWYPIGPKKKDKSEQWLPFTKENLKIWLEEFVYFLDQADFSVVVDGD